MLEPTSLSGHLNGEFSFFLALSKSELEAGGLLYYEADRMSSLKIFLTLTYPWAYRLMAIYMSLGHYDWSNFWWGVGAFSS